MLAEEQSSGSSIASEGCEVYGEVHSSVLGPDVLIKKGAVVRDSILMENVVIEEGAVVDRCIIDRKQHYRKGCCSR